MSSISDQLNACDKKIETLALDHKKLRSQKSGLMHDLLTGNVLVTIDETETAHAD